VSSDFKFLGQFEAIFKANSGQESGEQVGLIDGRKKTGKNLMSLSFDYQYFVEENS
jgi:hypothetical protein